MKPKFQKSMNSWSYKQQSATYQVELQGRYKAHLQLVQPGMVEGTTPSPASYIFIKSLE